MELREAGRRGLLVAADGGGTDRPKLRVPHRNAPAPDDERGERDAETRHPCEKQPVPAQALVWAARWVYTHSWAPSACVWPSSSASGATLPTSRLRSCFDGWRSHSAHLRWSYGPPLPPKATGACTYSRSPSFLSNVSHVRYENVTPHQDTCVIFASSVLEFTGLYPNEVRQGNRSGPGDVYPAEYCRRLSVYTVLGRRLEIIPGRGGTLFG